MLVTAEAEEEEAEEVEKIPPPPGVTIRDVELFKKVQQTTAEVDNNIWLSFLSDGFLLNYLFPINC